MSLIWTDAENNYIRANANYMKDKDLAKTLSKKTGRHISMSALRKHRQRLKIAKVSGRGLCGVKF